MKKALLNFCRIFVGLLFIFSGLIKANDPLGFGYKLEEYFEVFHIYFLHDYSVAIAIILCSLEIFLGALLLFGFRIKQVAWGLLLLIIFFTFLTFYSAWFKVVTSCGCFGDAIPLTPWQSFSKDLVLLALISYIFFHRKDIHPVTNNPRIQSALFTLAWFGPLAFGLFTYNYSPVVDFLPYKVGNNIPSLMKAPPGAPQDEYEIIYTLKHKKTGESKVMSDKEYLKTGIWKDSNWEIIGNPESKLIKKGYDIKITDLKLSDSQGTDYTSEIIESPYYNIVVVAYDLRKANRRAIGDINAIAINAAENYNIRTVLLTSNSAVDAEAFKRQTNWVSEIYYADAVPLKSMVRANPGVMLFKNGTVIDKWHHHLVPSYEKLEKEYFAKRN